MGVSLFTRIKYFFQAVLIASAATAIEVVIFYNLGIMGNNFIIFIVLLTILSFYPIMNEMVGRDEDEERSIAINEYVERINSAADAAAGNDTPAVLDAVIPEYEIHPVIPHIIFYGHGGTGKTTLARLYSEEIKKIYGHEVEFFSTVSSQFREKEDIDRMIFDMMEKPYSILFIDEIHGLPIEAEEALYSAMQDFYYVYTDKDGRKIEIKIPPFTLMGATTMLGLLSTPFIDRFTIKIEMERPDKDAMRGVVDAFLDDNGPQTIDQYAGQEKAKSMLFDSLKAVGFTGEVDFTADARDEIAERSMFVPRIGVQNTKGILEYAKSRHLKEVTDADVDRYFAIYEIDANGLSAAHRRVIKALLIQGKPMGRPSLANAADVGLDDIKAKYLPELIQMGLAGTDNRGWVMTKDAAEEKYGYLKGDADVNVA